MGIRDIHRGFVDKVLLKITDFMAKIPAFAHKRRWILLLSFILFTGFLGFGATKVVLDQSMDSFFIQGDPAIVNYKKFRYIFGSDEFVIIMYKPKNGDIFSKESLEKVKALEDDLNQQRVKENSPLNRITRIRSIVSADYLESRKDTLINRKFIGNNFPKNKRELEKIRRLAMAHKHYPENFFSTDSRLGIIMMETNYGARIKKDKKPDKKDKVSPDKSDDDSQFDFGEGSENGKKMSKEGDLENIPELESPQMDSYSGFINTLDKVLKKHDWYNTTMNEKEPPFMDYIMTGNPWMMAFFYKIIMEEMGIIIGLSILLIVLTLFVSFRAFSATLWPTLIIILANVWTMGLMGYLGIVQSAMINIVIFLVLTVGIASSIHILSGYRFYQAKGEDLDKALELAFRKSGISIMLAAITTMAGMLSLLYVPIVPIQNFAIAAGVGVAFTFFGTIFFLPVLLTFWSPKLKIKNGQMKDQVEKVIQKILINSAIWTRGNRKKIIVIFAVVMLASMTGYSRIIVDTNFVETVKPGNGIIEAYRMFDKYFGGASTVEVIVDAGVPDGMKDPKMLKAMDVFAQKVTREKPNFIARNNSLVKVAKESYKTMTDGTEKNYIIPDDPNALAQTLLSFESADPNTRKLVVDDQWRRGRISLSVYNKSSYEYEELIPYLERTLDTTFVDLKTKYPKLKLELSGGTMLMMRLMGFVSISQIRSFGIVLLVVSIILLVLYGSFRFGLIALIPNVFPIMLVAGLVGWMKIPLDSDMLLVMPIAIGIAVDDTIHFLTHYKTELLRGYSRWEAIENSLKEVGQAMVFTSVILTIGFLVFLASVYKPLSYFGIFSSVAVFTALLADLFLLPALIMTFKPLGKKYENGWNNNK